MLWSSLKSKKCVQLTALVQAVCLSVSVPVYALPTGSDVQAGSVNIETVNGNTMNVNQSTQKAVVNWQSFSSLASESIVFKQPNASSVILNRVVGANASLLNGAMNANGHVFLINPNGILFGATSTVNVGALLASTQNISNENFLNGHYRFQGSSTALIQNQGLINARSGGYAAVIAKRVENTGTINTPNGTTAIAAGEQVDMDMYGDGKISLRIEVGQDEANLLNQGTISADGGHVAIKAQSADQLVESLIKNEGVIRAKRIVKKGGEVYLDAGEGGKTISSGVINVEGKDSQSYGGKVTLLGDRVGLFDSAEINADGSKGGGEVLVGGNYKGEGPERNALRTYTSADATISASATDVGDGGRIIVWGNEGLNSNGTLLARGGNNGGNGGFVETSSHGDFSVTRAANVGASKGKGGLWLIDPLNLTINNVADTSVTGGTPFSPTGAPAVLTWATINTGLGTGAVTVTTVGTTGTDAGDITITEAGSLTTTGGNLLTFEADNNINVNASITRNGAGGITFDSARTTPAGTVNLNADVTTNNGAITIDTVAVGGTTLRTLTSGTATTTMGSITGGAGSKLQVNGNADFNGAVTGLETLEVTGTSDIGANVTTTGTQTYLGAVTLSGGDRTLTGTTVSTQAALAGGGNSLTVDGNADIDGAITAVKNLSVTGTSNIGANVTTTGTQTYTGNVTLDGTLGTKTLTGTTVNTQAALAGGGNALTVDGNADIDGAITAVTNLSVTEHQI